MGNGPLRVGLDASAAAVERPTGVALAIQQQARALAAQPGLDLTVLYRLSRLRRLSTFVRGPRVRVFHDRFAPVLSRRLDVFHGPDARLPRFSGPALVATVHDLSAWRDPRFAPPGFRETRARHWEDVARRADLVVTYTAAVRDEVARRLSIPHSRTAVVPLAATPAAPPPANPGHVLASLGLASGHVLFLGEASARKNLAGAAQALARASARSPAAKRLVLAVAGRPGHGGDDELARARAAVGPERVRVLGYLDAPARSAVLASARALVFPSRYEGFGLPVLEAFAAGVPVLASLDPSVVEVSGGAALHADADDADALGERLAAIIDDASLAASLAAKGRARAARFTWEGTARALARVYEAARAHAPAPEPAEAPPCPA